MKYVKIQPKTLEGVIDIPPSKSLSHRAVISAALSEDVSNISNLIFSDDINATCEAMKNLGANIEKKGDATLKIQASLPLEIKKANFDCKESGSTIRFLIPISLLAKGQAIFRGEGKLISRPLDAYYNIFDNQKIKYKNNNGRLPLKVEGNLKAGEFKVEGGVSSQFISGLLFTLPLLDGDSRIIITSELESKAYVDLTIDILKKFGIDIVNKTDREYLVRGNQRYRGYDYKVEGDFSQGAFWLIAGILGSEVLSRDLSMESLQADKAIVNTIKEMGGDISIEGSSIRTRKSNTRGVIIDASQSPDIIPILTVLAALSEGETKIINGKRLRIKESDRLKAISTELNKLGADIKELDDGLVIKGKKSLKGGLLDSWNDHRIAMALAVASIRCTEPVIITNSNVVNKSYPHFWEDFIKLGGNLNEFDMGE